MAVNDDAAREPPHCGEESRTPRDPYAVFPSATHEPRELHPRAQARAARIAAGERCAACDDLPPAALLVGIGQFNAREYFECHETLEGIWNLEPGPVRVLYKGILQVGVGCHHLLRGNYRGASLKLQSGVHYLEAFAPTCMQVDVAGLIAQARRLHAEVVRLGPEQLGSVDRDLLPQVSLHA
jgi:predicted metal-dependent hydrolase